jgi:hypothetical protein
MIPAWCLALLPVSAQEPEPAAKIEPAAGESFFAEQLYPVMHRLQCNLCHNDNGVAAETAIEFPGASASQEQITAFGLKLMAVVDREHPEQSLLLRKPTNREEHTGGERIKPGSAEEKLLRAWVDYLAGLSGDQVRDAKEKVARAERLALMPLTVRRLTHSQYNHTVHDLLGDLSQPANNFPKEDFIRGFKNQIEGQGVSPLQAEAYSQAAEQLAAAAFRGGDPRGLIPRLSDEQAVEGAAPGKVAEEKTAREFVQRFGLKVFRRPLLDDEAAVYTGLFQREAARTGVFQDGAKVVVEAMLQSPHFLFRVERGPGGPFAQYEIASRLSYFLWDTMPSDEMFQAAAKGEFATADQIETAARRMLDDPRARPAMDEFLAQWMRFDAVLAATRDRRRFRDYNSELAAAMVEETRQLFNHLVWEDRNFMEFFTAGYTFVNSDLARLYGLPEPAEEFAAVMYPEASGRSGVLGHGSFLVLTSKPAETSPTARGLFVRNHFLGHEVPPPPPGVNTVLPEVSESKPLTNRDRLGIHLNSEACASCHRLIDPIGLGFEQYNAIGAFQEKMALRFGSREKSTTVELDVDTSAYIQGVPESAFSTPRELGRILASNESCQKCIVKQLFRYTFGREETTNDQPVIDALLARFRNSGFRFRDLILGMVTSRLFLQEGSG